MVVQLSVRRSLRWLPDDPYEPTDTLVLDVGVHFVDLRILKETGSIDWAMAGKRTVLSERPCKQRQAVAQKTSLTMESEMSVAQSHLLHEHGR